MKTKNSPLILTLLLALLAFIPAAQAQGDGYKQWGTHALRVHTQPGKRPTIADFARAFTKQYPTPLNTAALAKLDGKAPQPKSCTLEYLLDAPSGYLKYCFHENSCNRTDYPTMEMCYWRTDAGHCLVAVNGNTYRGNLLLVFYDYNPTTGLMTPRSALPFKDFYDDVREFIVQLPRKGKDIHMEGWSDRSAPAPLTLRWDGLGGFTLVGAAERYRQPGAGLYQNGQFPATFKTRFGDSDEYPTPFNVHFGKSDEAIPRYNGPSSSATHPITPGDFCYDITVKKVQTGRAYIHYAQMSEDPTVEPSYDHAWVDCSSLYVLLRSRHESVAMTLFAEPTRTSRPLQTIKNEYVDDSQIRPFPWQLLDAREGWLKVRHLRTHVTGWVESRFASSDFVQ